MKIYVMSKLSAYCRLFIVHDYRQASKEKPVKIPMVIRNRLGKVIASLGCQCHSETIDS